MEPFDEVSPGGALLHQFVMVRHQLSFSARFPFQCRFSEVCEDN
jgi:hypothetical protein